MNPLYVGIDVSSKTNVTYIMQSDGSKHSSFSVQNNRSGAKLLSEKIVSAFDAVQMDNVVISLEATSIYGDSLVYALRKDGRLGQFGHKIHVLNPKQVRKFKETYPDLPKNDYVDAFVIADHLRFGRIASEVCMDGYRCKALQTLTRAHFCAVRNLTREKQRFANYLFFEMLRAGTRENPPTQHQRHDHRLNGTVCHRGRAGIRWPRYVDRLHRQVGPGTVCRPAATAKAVQATAKSSYRLPKIVNNSVNQAMSVIIASIQAIESQIKTLDKAIEQQLEIISNTLTSIHGIGKVYSVGIIAEVGDILVLVYKCGQEKLNDLYYEMKEQRRCSTWRKIKNRILRNLSSRLSICIMPEEPRIHNWNVNMA
ncbi:MAG: IS110 family transposase [Ruminococcus sp.]|nr:IS110 family transposase [Ruminococcus sp.]